MTDTREEQFKDNSIQQPNAELFGRTLLANALLTQRLFAELRFAGQQLKIGWPRFKQEPVRFTRTAVNAFALALQRRVLQPQMRSGIATALMLLMSVVAVIVMLDKRSSREAVKPVEQFELSQQAGSSSAIWPRSWSGVMALSSTGRPWMIR